MMFLLKIMLGSKLEAFHSKPSAALSSENVRLEAFHSKLSEGYRVAKEQADLATQTALEGSKCISELEAKNNALQLEVDRKDAALKALLGNLAEKEQEVELGWMNAEDCYGEACKALDALGDVQVSHAYEVARRGLLEIEVERLSAEVGRLENEVASVRSEEANMCQFSRVEGARDFKKSRVFKHLVANISGYLASILRSNAIEQAARLGGFRADFDPAKYLKLSLDGQFREYADDGSLTFSADDEFFALQFNPDADADLLPPEITQGAPQIPQYPPRPPKRT